MATWKVPWVWLKIFNTRGKPQVLSTMFPLTRVPFWYRFFEPQPHGNFHLAGPSQVEGPNPSIRPCRVRMGRVPEWVGHFGWVMGQKQFNHQKHRRFWPLLQLPKAVWVPISDPQQLEGAGALFPRRPTWVWLKIFNTRGKPQVLSTMFPLTRASHFGPGFLSHGHLAPRLGFRSRR